MDTLLTKYNDSFKEKQFYIAAIDGNLCNKIDSFLSEIAIAFKFPDYYGSNMNALNDCINDLEWLDSNNYILVINHSKAFLKDESIENRNSVYNFLKEVENEWANVPNFEGEDAHRNKAIFKIWMI
ncbi:MAG: barstar family protein [Bacteroidota bacterium]